MLLIVLQRSLHPFRENGGIIPLILLTFPRFESGSIGLTFPFPGHFANFFCASRPSREDCVRLMSDHLTIISTDNVENILMYTSQGFIRYKKMRKIINLGLLLRKLKKSLTYPKHMRSISLFCYVRFRTLGLSWRRARSPLSASRWTIQDWNSEEEPLLFCKRPRKKC